MHPEVLVVAGFIVLVLLCAVTVAVARQIERSRPPEDPMALLLAAPSPRPRRRRRISPAMAQRLAAAGYFDSMPPPGLSLAQLVAPPPGLCTDNGVMVAWAAHERLDAGVARLPRPAGMPDPAPDGWVDCRPRWPLAAPTRAFVEELGGSARWMKSARLHESLTELTREVLLGQGRGGGAEGSEDGGGGGARRPPSPPPPPLEEVAL